MVRTAQQYSCSVNAEKAESVLSPSDLLSLTAFLSVKSGDFVIAEIHQWLPWRRRVTGEWASWCSVRVVPGILR